MRLAELYDELFQPLYLPGPIRQLKGHLNGVERSLINGKDLATFEAEATERLIITSGNQGFPLTASMPRQRRQS